MSSNGRTRVSEARYGGSSPSAGTNFLLRCLSIGRKADFESANSGSSPLAATNLFGN